MTISASWIQRSTCHALLCVLTLSLSSCGAPVADFRLNAIYALNQEKTSGELTVDQKGNVKDILLALFGTPDEPHVPTLPDVDINQLFNLSRLQFAAGSVGSDQSGVPRGLYREHCAHCHGITGDGRGPTASFLNPYPRDYRRGLFKFKSTPGREPPTHDDLNRILINGIPGTSMPSFRLLGGFELEALVDYVKYLSVRGEVERRLIFEISNELEEGELLWDPYADAETAQAQGAVVTEIVSEIVSKWLEAEGQITPVPPRPAVAKEESIRRGRELFFGAVANCSKCHGDTGLGDGVLDDYDDWTKELDPKNPDSLQDFLRLGALPPRNAQPRNLRLNVFRGGRRPIDLFWRIHNGIAGTPMPAAKLKTPGAAENAPGLTTDDIWHLIDYVRSLPYEAISEPPQSQPAYQRDRL